MKQADKRVSNKAGQNKVFESGGTTPVPNDLLDRVMPTLRDTELRVLLVVVRQTLGWQDGPDPVKRKEKDWLTQSQLMRRTGRASGAVSRAVDALVQAGLISVTNRAGAPMKAADERRRHLGRLYYQVGSGGESVDNLLMNEENSRKSKQAKAHTTKETVIQKYKGNEKMQDDCRRIQGSFREKPFVIRTKGWEKATHQK